MSNRKSFILYFDLLGSLDQLSDAQAGKLFKAIKAYHMSVSEGATQDCKAEFESLMDDFVTRLAFHPFRTAFERDAERYQSLVDRNRQNGRKGGRKKLERTETQKNPENPVGYLGFQENPKEPKQTHNDNDNGNDNDKLSVSPKGETCPASKPDEPPPYTLIMDFWNKAMEGKAIQGVSRINTGSKRAANVRARLKEFGIEKVYQAIINAAESKFLNGYNRQGWTATFDWAFLPSNFIKILDGNYKNQEQNEIQPTQTYQRDCGGGVPIKGRIVPDCGLKGRHNGGET